MSAPDPYAATFELQRTAIESARTAALGGVALSRTATETTVGSLDAARSVQESGVDLTRRAVDAYLDAIAGTDAEGVDEVRTAVDEAFAAVAEANDEAWTAVERTVEEADGVAADLTDDQREAVAAAFDALLAAQADAEEGVDVDVDEA